MRVLLGGTLIVSRCDFHDNLVVGGSSAEWHTDGGAVTITNAHANISDCTFANNSASASGSIGAQSSTFHVTRSRFIDSHARTAGGAVYLSPAYGSVTPSRGVIEYCEFVVRARRRACTRSPGCILLAMALTTARSLSPICQNCTASVYASAFFVSLASVEVRHTTFLRCRQYRSGAVYALTTGSWPVAELRMTDARARATKPRTSPAPCALRSYAGSSNARFDGVMARAGSVHCVHQPDVCRRITRE